MRLLKGEKRYSQGGKIKRLLSAKRGRAVRLGERETGQKQSELKGRRIENEHCKVQGGVFAKGEPTLTGVDGLRSCV